MSPVFTLLLVNFLVAFALFVALWLVTASNTIPNAQKLSIMLGSRVLSVTSAVQTGDMTSRKLLLVGLCAAWGLRLGGYLFWRWRKHGADRRYVTMMSKAQSQRGWGYAKASFILVFALQAPLLWIVCLPVQLGQVSNEPASIGALGWIGVVVAVIGILFETIGDAQLVRFKADPGNAGKVMQAGLWRYTRHPNYFGDVLAWWGLYLIAAETAPGLWALPGPVLLTYLLLKWSGVPTVEHRLGKSRPGYADYVRRTSGFIPLPPRA